MKLLESHTGSVVYNKKLSDQFAQSYIMLFDPKPSFDNYPYYLSTNSMYSRVLDSGGLGNKVFNYIQTIIDGIDP